MRDSWQVCTPATTCTYLLLLSMIAGVQSVNTPPSLSYFLSLGHAMVFKWDGASSASWRRVTDDESCRLQLDIPRDTLFVAEVVQENHKKGSTVFIPCRFHPLQVSSKTGFHPLQISSAHGFHPKLTHFRILIRSCSFGTQFRQYTRKGLKFQWPGSRKRSKVKVIS